MEEEVVEKRRKKSVLELWLAVVEPVITLLVLSGGRRERKNTQAVAAFSFSPQS